MKENTVKLKLADYNELMDFKRDIENNNTFVLYESILSGNYTKIISNDESVKMLAKINFQLRKNIDDLPMLHLEKERQLVKLKHMSIWQFIKWRKTVKL